MKSKQSLSLLVFTLVLIVLIGQIGVAYGSGGPDDGGYIYEDSTDPGGPVYSWDDISTTGTSITLANDAMSPAISIPFPFTFYGTQYNNFYISSNGFLTFLSGQPNARTPASIPTTATPNAIIAGYWANLNPQYIRGGASIRYQVLGSPPNQQMVVAFIGVPHSGEFLSPTRSTFEIKLFEGSNNIEIHYNTMASNGTRHVVGIENESGTAGLTYFDDPADTIANGTAVRFSLFTGVAVRPAYAIQYGPPGSTVTFTQRVANWTGAESTFTLNTSGETWNTRLSMGPKDFTTTALAQGESTTFTVEVDIPPDAVPSNSSQLSITVEGNGYSDSATLVAAVPRRGYGLGYYGVANDDAYSAILPLDTTFHNSLHEQIDGTELGPFLYFGAAIRPDIPELWIVSAAATSTDGTTIPPRIYKLGIDELGNLAGPPYPYIDVNINASDIAFTPDGQYAVVSGYGPGAAALIDTSSFAVTGPTLSTGADSEQVGTGACLPRKAYITNNGTSGTGANSVSVIDINEQRLIKNITGFNKPVSVVISPTEYRAFVTNNGNGTIGVIDTQTDTRITNWTNIGSTPTGIDITPDGSRLYVAAGSDVKVVDTSTGTVIATIPMGVDSLYDIEVFPAEMGTYAYVTTQNTNVKTIMVIDTTTNTLIKRIDDDWNAIGLALFPMETECAMGPVAPVAQFTPRDVVARVNEPVTWTNTSLIDPTSYLWDFGDGTPTSTEVNPTHTYTAEGSYIVTLTASNDYGSSSATGTVNFAPTAAFSPAVSVIGPGESISFTNQSHGTNTATNPLTSLWNFGDSTPTSTEVNPTHTFAGARDVTVTLTAHNGFGDDSTATGTVRFRPRAQFTPTQVGVTAGETVNFTDQSTGPGPFTYLWDFGDNTTSSLQNPSHAYSISGVYTARLTVTNANGSDTTSGVVGFKPVANFNPSASTVNINERVTFTNLTTGPEPITYSWDFGDGSATSTVKDAQHQYTAAGNYTVTLTATNTYGSNQKTSTVTVRSNGTTVPDLTISKSHTGNFSQGQTGAQYHLLVTNAGSGPSSGTVTVVDTLPAGLTATALSGTGWNCTLATLTCTRSGALAAGSSYPEILLTTNVAADAPATLTNSASVSGGGEENTGNNNASDPTTVTPVSGTTAKIAPTSATCAQFANGTAAELSAAVYTVRYNRIWTVSPSEFLYYVKVVAPATTFQVGVPQSNDKNWPAISVSRANAYKANCTSQSATITTGTTPTIRVNNATVGSTYYIAVRYRLSGLVYRTITSPYPTVTYTLLATLNNVEVNTSRASIKIRP